MTILLQNKTTLEYVDGTKGWTMMAGKAREFGTGIEAILFCLNHRMANMQIRGEFADPRMNFTVPLTDMHAD